MLHQVVHFPEIVLVELHPPFVGGLRRLRLRKNKRPCWETETANYIQSLRFFVRRNPTIHPSPKSQCCQRGGGRLSGNKALDFLANVPNPFQDGHITDAQESPNGPEPEPFLVQLEGLKFLLKAIAGRRTLRIVAPTLLTAKPLLASDHSIKDRFGTETFWAMHSNTPWPRPYCAGG